MSETNKSFPFQALGARLRRVRERLNESIIEVSGAVEIDADALREIERGRQRPSEDILLLLISHFALKDAEATKLWNLANYNQSDISEQQPINYFNTDTKQAMMALPADIRILYSDTVHIMINNYGVVINFMQNTGATDQPLVISRVGMSKDHARSVLEVLQRTLDQASNPNPPKQLPQPKNQQPKQEQ